MIREEEVRSFLASSVRRRQGGIERGRAGKGEGTSFGRDNSVIYETPGLLMEISLKNELRRPPWRHHLDKQPSEAKRKKNALISSQGYQISLFLVANYVMPWCDLDAHYLPRDNGRRWKIAADAILLRLRTFKGLSQYFY